MYTENRDAYRQTFFITWEKHLKQLPIEALEIQLLEIILMHPEYHSFLDKKFQTQEFEMEENPFFHMSLHLAIREQINLDRPNGIRKAFETLTTHLDKHSAAHLMMDCLAEMLRNPQADEKQYLEIIIKRSNDCIISLT